MNEDQERSKESALLAHELREHLLQLGVRVESIGVKTSSFLGVVGVVAYVQNSYTAGLVPKEYAGYPVETVVVGRIRPAGAW